MLLILCLLQSCGLDQVEDNYPDYQTANNNELFDKGWIPREIVFQSMTEIHQRTNIDLNSCYFHYQTSKEDIQVIKQRVIPIKMKFEKPRRIRISSKNIQRITGLNYYYIISEFNDTVFIAIDLERNKIYGWRK
jgi:hypothetical protein